MRSNTWSSYLFKVQFTQILIPDPRLVVPSAKIDWRRFERTFVDGLSQYFGVSAISTRLMAVAIYINHAIIVSADS